MATDPQASPISKLLETLGLTREDLLQRSDQMRRFLTSDTSNNFDTSSTTSLSSANHSSSRLSTSTSSMARSMSRSRSTSFRDASPPMTPVKAEPTEGTMPPRQYDSMEMVLERQRRQNRREKKNRKEKEKEMAAKMSIPQPHSPSPITTSHPNLNLDTFMQSRDDRRVSAPEAEAEGRDDIDQTPPVTPQKGNYYRDRSYPRVNVNDCQNGDSSQGTALRSHYVMRAQFAGSFPPLFTSTPLPLSGQTSTLSSDLPVTPQLRRVYPEERAAASSPLLRSSSPPSSSPLSSPNKPIVNLVSSPGPMGPAPLEDDYSDLPYTLPPGPYSTNKPDQSYAALIGQAILSSPDHRLTLQEIYDWITIVYPYFKRGETTWMNSIRHVLSTTAVFRKVPRERTVGRSFWAIWDEDLPCFKDGGFKKHLCKDMNGGRLGIENPRASRVRKRDPDTDTMKKAKKMKRANTASEMMPSASASSAYLFPAIMQPTHPLFPPVSHATPCHQPYLQSCMSASMRQPLPPDVIFPPLPPTSAYRQLTAAPTIVAGNWATSSRPSSSATSSDEVVHADEAQDTTATQSIDNPPSSDDLPSCPPVPELTPNRSSSPTSSAPPTHKGPCTRNKSGDRIPIADESEDSVNNSASTSIDDDGVFEDGSLRPVKDWSKSSAIPPLEPSLMLNFEYGDGSDYVGNEQSMPMIKSKKAEKPALKKAFAFPPMPSSPTPAPLRPLATKQSFTTSVPPRLTTPPPKATALPVTPPQNHRISPIHTPLSHKGLHMSPNASLAHYKSNLDPPPIVAFNRAGEILPPGHSDENSNDAGEPDILKTPSKKRTHPSSSGIFNPVTPKRLVFPTSSALMESPLRTPSNGINLSPFRTPTSRGIFDPHDPGHLLDEELSRLGTVQDSPAGLFGKSRSALLYESPNIGTSPGSCPRWW